MSVGTGVRTPQATWPRALSATLSIRAQSGCHGWATGGQSRLSFLAEGEVVTPPHSVRFWGS